MLVVLPFQKTEAGVVKKEEPNEEVVIDEDAGEAAPKKDLVGRVAGSKANGWVHRRNQGDLLVLKILFSDHIKNMTS